MHFYFHIFGRQVPAYGTMIVTGTLIASLLALALFKYINKKAKKPLCDTNDFIVVEGYAIFGAFFGAKLLYLLVSYKDIEWNRIFEISYFNDLMKGGFVFYGGFIGGILFALLAGKIHKIDVKMYIRIIAGFIPFAHAFGRIGCHLAGCCYGKPYEGWPHVIFPEGSSAPAGVKLFPVQLTEAVCLFIISAIVVTYTIIKVKAIILEDGDLSKLRFKCHSVEMYLILYSILRFVLEYFRYDSIRGFLGALSTSQWISIGLFVAGWIILIGNISKKPCKY